MSEMAWNYVSDMFSHLLLNNSISPEDKRYVASHLPEIVHALSKLPFKSGEDSPPEEIPKIIAFMNKTRETAITADELIKFTSTEGISLSILSIGIGIGLMEHDRNSKDAVFFLTQFGHGNRLSM